VITTFEGLELACLGLAVAMGLTCSSLAPDGESRSLAVDSCNESSIREASSIVVTVDLFSGRPNPSWTLAPRHREELSTRLGASRPDPSPVEEVDSKLGYRGFVLTWSTGPDSVQRLRIREGRAYLTTDTASPVEECRFRDEGRELEAWLLELAVHHLPDYAERLNEYHPTKGQRKDP
jgi:hypothetical protein